MFARLLLGVLASVTGSLGHSLGMTLQKRAHLRLEALGSNSKTWRDSEWQAGLALYLFSSTVPPTLALSILPVFVAAPLAAVGLVANAVFARYILSSTFARTDAFGTLLVALGSSSVAVFGAIDEPPLSLAELMKLYRRKAYAVFFAGIYCGCLGADSSRAALEAQVRQAGEENRWCAVSEPWVRTLIAGAARVPLGTVGATATRFTAGEGTPLLADSLSSYSSVYASSTDSLATAVGTRRPTPRPADTEPALPPTPTQPPATGTLPPASLVITDSSASADSMFRSHFSQASGILAQEAKVSRAAQLAKYISGQTLLLAKSGIGLLVLTVRGNMQFNDPLAVAIVVGLVATALANLYYIQRALRLCSTLTVVPLTYCSSSLMALIKLLSTLQIAMISIGIVLLAVGVMFLSSKTEDQEGPLHLPPEDPDDVI
ncbi:hypothetical protein DL89DRAFT_294173 [Linderina pennispora]|uniref:EamA domain-containing protein n=1 Tax=Linderina pennispora TaxID=61395 RepID=A0A1Y1W4F8_9FUNG|nr:uncharacterized protein DL89DRAFT_294173 [Linderina pennispora]ORX68272.1 hypothetical protein DL89DRAFT_294173 [Linderina pennispora]